MDFDTMTPEERQDYLAWLQAMADEDEAEFDRMAERFDEDGLATCDCCGETTDTLIEQQGDGLLYVCDACAASQAYED